VVENSKVEIPGLKILELKKKIRIGYSSVENSGVEKNFRIENSGVGNSGC